MKLSQELKAFWNMLPIYALSVFMFYSINYAEYIRKY